MDVGEPAEAHVFHQRAQRPVVELDAVDLGAQVRQRILHRRMSNLHLPSARGPEQRPSGFRQGDLVVPQPIAGHVMKDREQVAATGEHLDLRLGLESFRSADRAIAAHVDHRLLVGVDAGATGQQTIGNHGR